MIQMLGARNNFDIILATKRPLPIILLLVFLARKGMMCHDSDVRAPQTDTDIKFWSGFLARWHVLLVWIFGEMCAIEK
jgi:hypothetical protein